MTPAGVVTLFPLGDDTTTVSEITTGPDGNVSVRLPGDRVLVTPAGMSKVDVTEEDLVELALDEADDRRVVEAGLDLRLAKEPSHGLRVGDAAHALDRDVAADP